MIKITAYRCEDCKRVFLTAYGCAKHELRCWRNPHRVPRVGEVTLVSQMEYAEGGAQPFPAWWPGETWLEGLGKIWDGKAWQVVPGWELGGSQKYGYYDIWPAVGPGSMAEDWSFLHIEMDQRLELLGIAEQRPDPRP